MVEPVHIANICFPAMSFFPILIWLVLVGFFLAVCMAIQEGVVRLRRLHQIPCIRCAFFTGDYRLKCTIHPCTALSEDAINCRDYEPITVVQPVRFLPKKSCPKKCSSCAEH